VVGAARLETESPAPSLGMIVEPLPCVANRYWWSPAASLVEKTYFVPLTRSSVPLGERSWLTSSILTHTCGPGRASLSRRGTEKRHSVEIVPATAPAAQEAGG